MEKKKTKAEGETLTCMKCGNKILVSEPEEASLA